MFRAHHLLLAVALLASSAALHAASAADGVTTLESTDGTTVVIYRDNYGVPHIRAASEAGVFYGQGYAVAQDRLFQMETYRRAALGRLSEVGIGAVGTDQQVRAVFYTESERLAQLAALPTHIREMIDAYTAGINRYLGEVLANPATLLPVQYHVLGFAPEPWTATQVVAVAQFFMRRFGQYGGQELTRLAELQANGPAWFEANRPLNDPAAPTTIWPSAAVAAKRLSRATPTAGKPVVPVPVDPDVIAEMDAERQAAEGEFKRLGVGRLGSFATLINTEKSASGNVMLLGAPQLGAPVVNEPNITNEVELDAPTLRVSGMAIAGIPGVVIGRTDKISWTLTSGNSDNTDTFIELLHPTQMQYFNDGQYHEFEVIPEPDLGATFARLRTVHGPVIGLDLANRMAFSWQMTFWNQELAMVEAFYDGWKAQNLEDFESVMRTVPMNFHTFYAGRDQKTSYWHVGRLLRSNQTLTGPDPRLPRLGDGSQEWGPDPFLTFDELPTTNGDLQDYIVNWNNKPVAHWNNGDNIIWSTVFQPERTLRVLKIENFVAPLTPFSYDDLKAIPVAAEDYGTYQQAIEFGGDWSEDRTENIIPPGQSGFIGLSGPDPHFADQWALHLQHAFKDMVYNTPVSIWPPNNQLATVDVRSFLDAADPGAACVETVWSDEPILAAGPPHARTLKVDGDHLVRLQASRDPSGNGRSYTIHVAAPDPVGYMGTAALFQAYVPHDQGDGDGVTDDGPVLSVSGPCGSPEPQIAAPSNKNKRGPTLDNHPNPFNPSTTIRYALADAGQVRLVVYDLLGRQIAVLVEAFMEAGTHEVAFDAGHLPTGMYLVQMRTQGEVVSRSIVLAK